MYIFIQLQYIGGIHGACNTKCVNLQARSLSNDYRNVHYTIYAENAIHFTITYIQLVNTYLCTDGIFCTNSQCNHDGSTMLY